MHLMSCANLHVHLPIVYNIVILYYTYFIRVCGVWKKNAFTFIFCEQHSLLIHQIERERIRIFEELERFLARSNSTFYTVKH